MNDYDLPDEKGHFGPYGGVFVAETLISALDDLRAYMSIIVMILNFRLNLPMS